MNIPEPSEFQWKAAIFDDDPEQIDVVNITCNLRSLGIACKIYGGWSSTPQRLGFFRNEDNVLEYIRACHLLLVDMEWRNLASEQLPLSLPDLSRYENSSELERGLSEFADLMEGRSTSTAKSLTARHINSDHRGFWIAAALSHVNPDARILFFSGLDRIIEGATAGAFMQFKTRPVDIVRKRSVTFESGLFNQLGILQLEMLTNSRGAYEWFVGRLLLPALIDAEPGIGECGPLYKNDRKDAYWKLSADKFFPQWKQWKTKGETLKELKKYLRPEPFRLRISQRRALWSVRHCLMRVTGYGHDRSTIDQALKTAYQIGPSGSELVAVLSEAHRFMSNYFIDRAIDLCNQIENNSPRQLWSYCEAFKKTYNSPDSQYCCDEDAQRKPRGFLYGGNETEASPPLPFDLEYLKRACEALIDNAKRHLPHGEALKASLQVKDTCNSIIITYADNSTGFASIKELGNAIGGSMQKRGLDRGLPLALAFGLHFPLTCLQVKISDGAWVQIYPDEKEIERTHSSGFGVRWVFPYQSEAEC